MSCSTIYGAICQYRVNKLLVSCKHGINFVKARAIIGGSQVFGMDKIGIQYRQAMHMRAV